jgi:hypothetical protein
MMEPKERLHYLGRDRRGRRMMHLDAGPMEEPMTAHHPAPPLPDSVETAIESVRMAGSALRGDNFSEEAKRYVEEAKQALRQAIVAMLAEAREQTDLPDSMYQEIEGVWALWCDDGITDDQMKSSLTRLTRSIEALRDRDERLQDAISGLLNLLEQVAPAYAHEAAIVIQHHLRPGDLH